MNRGLLLNVTFAVDHLQLTLFTVNFPAEKPDDFLKIKVVEIVFVDTLSEDTLKYAIFVLIPSFFKTREGPTFIGKITPPIELSTTLILFI
jgi:hypothetical protein